MRARRPHSGKPTHFLAEDLRHALVGFGGRPTFRHVNMDLDFNFDDDFTLFSSESDCGNNSSNSKMAFPQQSIC